MQVSNVHDGEAGRAGSEGLKQAIKNPNTGRQIRYWPTAELYKTFC